MSAVLNSLQRSASVGGNTLCCVAETRARRKIFVSTVRVQVNKLLVLSGRTGKRVNLKKNQ